MECIYCVTYEGMQRIYVNVLKLVLAKTVNGYLSTEKRFDNEIIHFRLRQNLELISEAISLTNPIVIATEQHALVTLYDFYKSPMLSQHAAFPRNC